MPILSISVTPVGTDDPSFSKHVAKAVKRLKERGIKFQVTPTATVMQGELDQLMLAAMDIHRTCLDDDTQRVITSITIDERKDKKQDLDELVRTVEAEALKS